jgi:hypothetical protein
MNKELAKLIDDNSVIICEGLNALAKIEDRVAGVGETANGGLPTESTIALRKYAKSYRDLAEKIYMEATGGNAWAFGVTKDRI